MVKKLCSPATYVVNPCICERTSIIYSCIVCLSLLLVVFLCCNCQGVAVLLLSFLKPGNLFFMSLFSNSSNEAKNPQSLLTKSNSPFHLFQNLPAGIFVLSINQRTMLGFCYSVATKLFPSRLVLSLSIPKKSFCRPCSAKVVPADFEIFFIVTILFIETPGLICCLVPFWLFQNN